MKVTGKIFSVFMLVALLMVPAFNLLAGQCTEMENDAEAIEGVVPSFDETGKFKSISMYADSSFIAPKRSLISAARKQAELKAKREFSNFIKEKVTSGTLSEYLMETKSVTNDKGETSGSAEEINRISDVIGNNTESVLSGIIKLDECVDVEGKFVMVRMGWKPMFSKIAADTRQTIDKEVARGESGSTEPSVDNNSSSQITPANGYRKKSSLANDF